MNAHRLATAAVVAAMMAACAVPLSLQTPKVPTSTPRPPSIATPSATQVDEPALTPTPNPLLLIREAIGEVLGAPRLTSEIVEQQYGRTMPDGAWLLSSLPEEQHASFLADYLGIPADLLLLGEAEKMAAEQERCPARADLVIPLTPDAFVITHDWRTRMDLGPPETAYDFPKIIIHCDDPVPGLRLITERRAALEASIGAEEDLAEAIMAHMLQDLFLESFGRRLPVRIELEPASATQIFVYARDSGEILAADTYPIEVTDDNRQTLVDRLSSEVFLSHPTYDFRIRESAAFAVDPGAPGPVIVTVNGVWTIPAAINGAAHLLPAESSAAAPLGMDQRSILETVAIIAERELWRQLLSSHSELARGAVPDLVLETQFDRNRLHIGLPDLVSPDDPMQVFGANQLGHRMFELRNCTAERGQGLREFYDRVKTIATGEDLSAALQECRGAQATEIALHPPTGTPTSWMEGLPITHEDIVTRVDPGWAHAWTASSVPISCLPELQDLPGCHAVAYGYTGLGTIMPAALRVHIAVSNDTSGAAAVSAALRSAMLGQGKGLGWPEYYSAFRPPDAWMVLNRDNGFLCTGFYTSQLVVVIQLRRGVLDQVSFEQEMLARIAKAQLERLGSLGFGPAPTPTLPPLDCSRRAGSAASSLNLLSDPSFEAGLGEAQSPWTVSPRNTNLETRSVSDTVRTGDHSLMLTASTLGAMGWPGLITTQAIPICPGRVHQLNVWAFSADGAGAWIQIDPGGRTMSSGCEPLPPSKWTRIKLELPPVSEPWQVHLGLLLCGITEGTPTTLYYDDVFFGDSSLGVPP